MLFCTTRVPARFEAPRTVSGDTVSAIDIAPARPRDAVAGIVAAVATVAVPLTLGLLAFAPLGQGAAQVGIPAAFLAASLGALVFAWRGRSMMPTAAVSSATALVITNLVAALARDPAVDPTQPAGIAAIVAGVAAAVLGMGLAQIAFGMLRLGAVAKYVPQPVLAGFMLGVAILIVIAQVPALLGVAPEALRQRVDLVLGIQPGALLVGCATALIVLLLAWRAPRVPGILLGLVAGCLLDAWMRASAPHLGAGERVGVIPVTLLPAFALEPWTDAGAADVLLRHLPRIVSTVAVLAILGSLESILGARATDQAEGTQHDANGDLVALGLANVASGIFGGLPVVYMRTRAALILQMGGRGRLAAVACALFTGALFLTGRPLLVLLSLPVLAGIMLVIALGLVDRWTRQLARKLLVGERTRDVFTSVGIVVLVCTVTVAFGFVAGVAVGILVAMLVFMHAMNRTLVRSRYSAALQPSRRVYPRLQEAVLRPLRDRVRILGLEGALFFGNVDRVTDELDALPAGTRFVILDLTRVTTIDASGAVELARQTGRLAATGIDLLIAGITPGSRHGRALRALSDTGTAGTRRWYPDVDYAVEAAELALLGEAGAGTMGDPVAFEHSSLAAGLGPRELETLLRHLERESFPRLAVIFREGDPGDRLYVVAEGSVTVLHGGQGGDDMPRRYVSFSPGMMFGELALLDGVGRSADAIANVPCVLYTLTRDAMTAIRAEDPVLSERLFVNIAAHLAQRLRTAAVALADATR